MALKSKSDARSRRHGRLRQKVVGSEVRPRLVVTRSARHVFVPVVDDSTGHTVYSASTLAPDPRPLDGDQNAKPTHADHLAPTPPHPARLPHLALPHRGNP